MILISEWSESGVGGGGREREREREKPMGNFVPLRLYALIHKYSLIHTYIPSIEDPPPQKKKKFTISNSNTITQKQIKTKSVYTAQGHKKTNTSTYYQTIIVKRPKR